MVRRPFRAHLLPPEVEQPALYESLDDNLANHLIRPSPFAFAYSLHQEGQQVSAMNSTRVNPLSGAVISGMSHGSPRTR